jgi:cation diffusion facilitator family transporter
VLLFNWAVALAKILYGFVSKSTAMSADGFHSFSDGASNIVGLIGIWFSSQPVDKDHPYGHKKYETFAAIVIAILLFMIAFNLIHDGIERIINPVIPAVTAISFIIMLCTIVVNLFVFFYENRKGRILKSDILIADSQHTKTDILVSISVIVTLLAVRAGYTILDTAVSMLIALFIAHGAITILRESSNILCDRAALVSDEIKGIVLGIDGVKNCHNIRTRGRMDDIHTDLHIVVDPKMHVGIAHSLNDKIEKAIREKIPGVTEVSIHIEPYNHDEKELAD